MTETSQHPPVILRRRGKVLYEENPSVAAGLKTQMRWKAPSKEGVAYQVVRESGEVIGKGAIGFIEEHEVDNAEFLKVYRGAMKQHHRLTAAGMTIFDLVFDSMSGSQGKDRDTVAINYFIARRWREDLTRRTYDRGLNDLLEKEFLYRSIVTDTYFINVNYIFNGDRLVVAKAYHRRKTTRQPQLAFDQTPEQREAAE